MSIRLLMLLSKSKHALMLQLMQTRKRWYKAGVETMQEKSTNANKSLGKQLTAAVVWLAMQQAQICTTWHNKSLPRDTGVLEQGLAGAMRSGLGDSASLRGSPLQLHRSRINWSSKKETSSGKLELKNISCHLEFKPPIHTVSCLFWKAKGVHRQSQRFWRSATVGDKKKHLAFLSFQSSSMSFRSKSLVIRSFPICSD